MEDEEMKLNPTKETVKGILFTEKADGQVPYVVVLKRIKNKELNPNQFIFIDSTRHESWIWSDEYNGMESLNKDYYFGDCTSSKYLTDDFDELDLIDLYLTLVPKEKEEDTSEIIAKKEIIEEIESQYMDLNMEIDNCQGCMDGLDEAFAKLRIYKDIVKYLGGDIDAHLQELTDKWFAEAHEKSLQEEKEQQQKDEVIKNLPFPLLDLITESNPVRDVLWKQNDKINEICNILREKFGKNTLQS